MRPDLLVCCYSAKGKYKDQIIRAGLINRTDSEPEFPILRNG